MKMKNVIAIILALVIGIVGLTACAQSEKEGVALAEGGVLVLSVNPEIAIEFDEKGVVTAVTARNDDAKAIVEGAGELVGKESRAAVTQLVSAIGEAGYFVEEAEGKVKNIVLELEEGSKLPHDSFIEELVSDINSCVDANDWNAPIEVENESDYGITDFDDTDYGAETEAASDYDATDYDDTDYDATDNGTEAATDYDDTDYDATDYDATDYDDTDYGETVVTTAPVAPAPVNPAPADTDYDDTDYDATDYDTTDYDATDYDDTDYDDTDYDGTDYDATDYDASDYGN